MCIRDSTYAFQQLQKEHYAKSRVNTWCETIQDDIRKFIGMMHAMGLISAPSAQL